MFLRENMRFWHIDQLKNESMDACTVRRHFLFVANAEIKCLYIFNTNS